MRFKWLVGAVLLVIGSYTAFWFVLASKVEEKILALIDEQRAHGLGIFYDDLSVEGFPYQIALKVSALKIHLPEMLDIDIPEITIVAQPWNLSHAVIMTDFIDVDYGQGAFGVALDGFKASVIVDRDRMRPERTSLFSKEVHWKYGTGGEVSVAHRVNLHLRRPDTSGEVESIDLPVLGEFLLTAHQITAPDLPVGVFGNTADSFRLESAFHARRLPDYTPSSLSAWRDEGGTIAVRKFEIISGEMSLGLDGDVTLDQDFKPLGAFSARIRGMDQIVSILSQHGAFMHEPGDALLEELRQMGQIQKDGLHKGEKILPLSISLQNGLLILGPIPVYELPAVIEPKP